MLKDRNKVEITHHPLIAFMPFILSLLLLLLVFITHGIVRIILLALFFVLTAYDVYQFIPIAKRYRLVMTKDGVSVENILGKKVTKVKWKDVEGVAVGYKKVLKYIYAYTIYFKVKRSDDINFVTALIDKDVPSKVELFLKTSVRRRIPFQRVKAE